MRGVVKFPIAGPPYALSVVRYDTIINHSKFISPGGCVAKAVLSGF